MAVRKGFGIGMVSIVDDSVIKEFLNGTRDVIFIGLENYINSPQFKFIKHKILNIDSSGTIKTVMVFRYEKDLKKYIRLKETNGFHYAVGIALGYHHLAVSWWSDCQLNMIEDDRDESPLISYRSFFYKVPQKYAVEILRDLVLSGEDSVQLTY